MVDNDSPDNSDENGSSACSDPSPVRTPPLWVYDDDGHDSWEHAETGLSIELRKVYEDSARHDDFIWRGDIRGDRIAEPLTSGGRHSLSVMRVYAAKFMNADPDGEYEPDNDVGPWERDQARWLDAFDHVDEDSADPDVWLR